MRRTTTVIAMAAAALLAVRAAAGGAGPPLPTWPTPTLGAGEHAGRSIYGAAQRWLSADGVPVVFHHVIRADGKGVLRAFWPGGRQDVLVHDFGADEMFVVHHDDGDVGFQFHRDVTGKPDQYLGVRARWTGKGFRVTRRQRFTGRQPTPAWLFDPVERVAPPLVAWRTMARGARSDDSAAFVHYFDDAPVAVDDGRGAATHPRGLDLARGWASSGLPLLGYRARCDRRRCCGAQAAPLAAWFHVERICFSAGPEPRVRSIVVRTPPPAAPGAATGP